MSTLEKWLGRIAIFVILQIGFVSAFFFFSGQWPQQELSLLWTRLKEGKSAIPEVVAPAKDGAADESAPKRSTPSFEESSTAAAFKRAETEQLAKQAQTLLDLAETRQAAVEADRKVVEKIRDAMKKDIGKQQDKAVADGQKKVTELLEAAKPNVAQSFLTSLTDDKQAIGIIKRLDPIQASKVMKEFKSPQDVQRLNEWLKMIDEGEPEASSLKNVEKSAATKN